MRHFTFCALACGALAYPYAVAHAQAPDPAGSPEPPAAPSVPEAPALTPPQLLQSVEPVYPESERQNGRAASVGLVLTLDAEGQVTDASVRESGGEAFDAAALDAARRLVFSPALQGETKIASKIPFRVEFARQQP